MAQIFVSHSAKDKELVSFLSKAFSSTNVKAVFEEFEAIFGCAQESAMNVGFAGISGFLVGEQILSRA
jgi:hypothetical protein